ncbi:HD-GYP domain-containing protein [Novipirellula rosea]|uniref:HD domain-containing protein n=1 Tax=Novipirellula rosea TaxID=1031540 RepID=A0ABP8MLS9_9BACT|tara:strand:- start:22559 stop:23821 length:1263 start_codon:yes stop_codon:yes gene_type:complete
MSRSETVELPLEKLCAGATCGYPILSKEGVLLLGSGTHITPAIVTHLQEQNVDVIAVHPNDIAELTGKHLRRGTPAESAQGESKFSGVWEEALPLKDLLVDRHDEPLSSERTEELNKCMSTAKARFEQINHALQTRDFDSISPLTATSDSFARSMIDDHDQTVGEIGAASNDVALERRSVQMAVMGMAVAVEMGLDGPTALEIGLTGLLHDIGLYVLDPKFRDPTQKLSHSERWEYEKHPVIAFDCVAAIPETPSSVRIAVQQVHEQYDGSGFPRGLRGARIHQYARILNVVDAYIQLISPSTNRCGILPHNAVGLILHQATRGTFDPEVVRAFLNTESLYPLGSHVELRSGSTAMVIRRSPHSYACPMLMREDGERVQEDNAENRIIRPIASPKIEQMRIPPSKMPSINWNPADNVLMV